MSEQWMIQVCQCGKLRGEARGSCLAPAMREHWSHEWIEVVPAVRLADLTAELHQANRRAAAFEHRVAELLEENKTLRERADGLDAELAEIQNES